MADNKNSGDGALKRALLWSPALAGFGLAAKNVYQDLRDTGYAGSATSGARNAAEAARIARDVALSANVVSGKPTNALLNQIQEMGTSRSWSRGLTQADARKAVAEATRASLFQGQVMPAADIDTLTQQILHPKLHPFEGTKTFFDVGAREVMSKGHAPTFMSILRSYNTGGFMPGQWFGQESLKAIDQFADSKATSGFTKTTARMQDNILGAIGYNQPESGGKALSNKVTFAGTAYNKTHQLHMVNLSLTAKGMDKPIEFSLSLDPYRHLHKNTMYATSQVIPGLPSQGMAAVSWQEYYLKQLEEDLIPKIEKISSNTALSKTGQSRAIRQAHTEFQAGMLKHAQLDMSYGSAGQRARTALHQKNTFAVPALSDTALRMNKMVDVEAEMKLLFEEKKLFPTGRPSDIMAGRFTGIDPRSMWAYGGDWPIERSPLQFLREMAPTEQALQKINSLNKLGAFGISGNMQRAADIGYQGARFNYAIALPESAAERALQGIGLEAEEVLMRQNVMSALETNRVITKDISLLDPVGQGKRIAPWLEQRLTGQTADPLNLIAGEQLGYEVGTGRSVSSSGLENVKQRILGATAINVDGTPAARLFIEEAHQSDDFVKMYGDFKSTTRGRNHGYFANLEKDIGSKFADDLAGITYFDQLKKNRSLLKRQMASATAILASQKMATGSVAPEVMGQMKQFLGMSAEQLQVALPDELAILRQAKAWNLDLGPIGGGMLHANLSPDIVEKAIQVAGGREALVPKGGMLLGNFQQFAGDYRWTIGDSAVDRLVKGSVEPRVFNQLLQHNWMVGNTNVAPMMATDLLQGMKSFKSDINAIESIVRTMHGESLSGLETLSIPEGNFKSIPLQDKGYLLDLGVPVDEFNKSSKLYVPGKEEMKRLIKFRGPDGDMLNSNILANYNRMARSAIAVRSGKDATEAYKMLSEASNEFQKTIFKEYGYSFLGKGQGSGVEGALRGKIAGSGYLPLSGVDKAIQNLQPNTYALSEKAASEMFADLESSAANASEKSFVQAQRDAFMKGQAVPVAAMRHPVIGDYSFQPGMAVKALDANSAKEYFVRASTGARMEIKAGQMEFQKNIGPLIGMAGDYDGDRMIMKFIGNEKTAKAVDGLMRGGNYINQYQKFALESAVMGQSFKNRMKSLGASSIVDVDQLVAGSMKLRITKGETGGLSNALSQAKLAVAAHNPEISSRFNLVAEMLEQHATISGKHQAGAAAGQGLGRAVADTIYELPRGKDLEVAKLSEISRSMFGDEVTKGIDIRARDIQTGGITTHKMRIDFDDLWKQVQIAMRRGNEEDGVLKSYQRLVKAEKLTGQHGVMEVARSIRAAKAGHSDALANLAASGAGQAEGTSGRGMAAKVAEQTDDMLRGIKKMAKQRGIQWGKPVLYGLAATAAATMILGAPKGQDIMPPVMPAHGNMHDLIPPAQIMGGYTSRQRDVSADSMSIPSGSPHGEMGPGLLSPRGYESAAIALNKRIQMQIDVDGANSGIMNSTLSSLGGGRIRYNDNRSKMTAYDVEQLMERP